MKKCFYCRDLFNYATPRRIWIENLQQHDFDQNCSLLLMCWGFRVQPTSILVCCIQFVSCWMKNIGGGGWYSKPHIRACVNRVFVEINGTYRHMSCCRLDNFGFGYASLACFVCSAIPLENDFRMRILPDDINLDKRGSWSTWARRIIGQSQIFELAKHNHKLSRKLEI